MSYPKQKRADRLPMRVYRLIEEAQQGGRQDVATWANDGAVFLVKDTEAFCKLLPRYGFVANWSSFHRNLNIHGFQRWVYPVDGKKGYKYFHPFFHEGAGLEELGCILRENVEGLRLRLSNSPDSAFPFKRRPKSFNPPGRTHVPLSQLEAETDSDDEIAPYREKIRRAARAREQQDARDKSRARRRAKVSDHWREYRSQFASFSEDENDLESDDDKGVESEAWQPEIQPWLSGKRSQADMSTTPLDSAPPLLTVLASSKAPDNEAFAPVAKKMRPATQLSVQAGAAEAEVPSNDEAIAKKVRVRKKKTNTGSDEEPAVTTTTAYRPRATTGVRPHSVHRAVADLAARAAELEAAKKKVAEAESAAKDISMKLFLSSRASLLSAVGGEPAGNVTSLISLDTSAEPPALIHAENLPEPPRMKTLTAKFGTEMDFLKDAELPDMLQFDPMGDFQYASEDKFIESIFQNGGSLF